MNKDRKGEIAVLYLTNELRISSDSETTNIYQQLSRMGLVAYRHRLRKPYVVALLRECAKQATLTRKGVTPGCTIDAVIKEMDDYIDIVCKEVPPPHTISGPIERPLNAGELAYRLVVLDAFTKGITVGAFTRRAVGNTAKQIGIPFHEAMAFAEMVTLDVACLSFYESPSRYPWRKLPDFNAFFCDGDEPESSEDDE